MDGNASCRNVASLSSLLLIRAEFLEIPRLQLTQTQVERLWGINRITADTLLRLLVDGRFLKQNRIGAYVRRTNNDGSGS